MGVLLYSNTSFRHSFAESLGLVRYVLSRLRVVLTRDINMHHRCSGKSGCKVDKPEMKWFL